MSLKHLYKIHTTQRNNIYRWKENASNTKSIEEEKEKTFEVHLGGRKHFFHLGRINYEGPLSRAEVTFDFPSGH